MPCSGRSSGLEEGPEKSYFTANTRKMAEELQRFHPEMEEREAWDLASCRIFGPKEGEYGTRLTDVVRKGSWKDAAEIGSSFTEDLSYGYSFRRRGVKAKKCWPDSMTMWILFPRCATMWSMS